MGIRRAFGALELLIIVVILAALGWFLFRSAPAGSPLPPDIGDAVRSLLVGG